MHVVTLAAEYDHLFPPRRHDKKIALVPTMGALHAGHRALIEMAKNLADTVVVSIFVNPLQFGPKEDLANYPRPLEQDLAVCRELGVDVVFTPTVETMYPDGLQAVTTVVPPASLTDRFCGEFRPGHFTGVATVVLKLLNLMHPDVAIFGEKDAQQLLIIRKLVKDLQVPVEIVAHPTIREESGLALSSRNQYLRTPAEQQAALSLYRILTEVRARVLSKNEPCDAETLLKEVSDNVISDLQSAEASIRLQYLAAVDRETFAPVKALKPGVKILIAAYVNQVRLIDNMDLV
jgi:pantoate--beta-alanine ligase